MPSPTLLRRFVDASTSTAQRAKLKRLLYAFCYGATYRSLSRRL